MVSSNLEIDYLPKSSTNTLWQPITTTKDSSGQFDITFSASGSNQWLYHPTPAFFSRFNQNGGTMSINFTAPYGGTLNMDITLRAFDGTGGLSGVFDILINGVSTNYNLRGIDNWYDVNNTISQNKQLTIKQGDQVSLMYSQTYVSINYETYTIDHGVFISNLKIINIVPTIKLNIDNDIVNITSNNYLIYKKISSLSISSDLIVNKGNLNIHVNYPITTDSQVFTGIPTAPTASNDNNTTQIATTAFVKNNLTKSMIGLGNVDNTSDFTKPISMVTQSALDLKAPKTSPAFTGTPTAPTASNDNNTTQIATTAFVKNAIDITGVNGKQDSSVTKSYTYNLNAISLPVQLGGLLTDRFVSNITIDSSGVGLSKIDYLPQSIRDGGTISTAKDSTGKYDIAISNISNNIRWLNSNQSFHSYFYNNGGTLTINFTAPYGATLNMDITLRAFDGSSNFGNGFGVLSGVFDILINGVSTNYNLRGVCNLNNLDNLNKTISQNKKLIIQQGDQISLKYTQNYANNESIRFSGTDMSDHGVFISNLKIMDIIPSIKLNIDGVTRNIVNNTSNNYLLYQKATNVSITSDLVSSGNLDIQVNYPLVSDSPLFLGKPTAPTINNGDNSSIIATTSFVQNAISGFSNDYHYDLNTSSFPIVLNDILTNNYINKITVDSSGIFSEIDYLPQSSTNTNKQEITTTTDTTGKYGISFSNNTNVWEYYNGAFFSRLYLTGGILTINFTAPYGGTLNMDITLRALNGSNSAGLSGVFDILINGVSTNYNLKGIAYSGTSNNQNYGTNNVITSATKQLTIQQGDQVSLKYTQNYNNSSSTSIWVDHGVFISNLKITNINTITQLNIDGVTRNIVKNSPNTFYIYQKATNVSITSNGLLTGTMDISVNYPLSTDSPILTGLPTAPTSTTTDNSTQIATTAFVQANKVSPAFTGIPTAPTATATNNSTQLATTAFVQANKVNPTFTGSVTATNFVGNASTATSLRGPIGGVPYQSALNTTSYLTPVNGYSLVSINNLPSFVYTAGLLLSKTTFSNAASVTSPSFSTLPGGSSTYRIFLQIDNNIGANAFLQFKYLTANNVNNSANWQQQMFHFGGSIEVHDFQTQVYMGLITAGRQKPFICDAIVTNSAQAAMKKMSLVVSGTYADGTMYQDSINNYFDIPTAYDKFRIFPSTNVSNSSTVNGTITGTLSIYSWN